MASIKISDLRLTTSGLPVDSKNYMTELWEELDKEQLKAVIGGIVEAGPSGDRPWWMDYTGQMKPRSSSELYEYWKLRSGLTSSGSGGRGGRR